MNKPNEYDTTRAAGEFTPIELGGHYLVIKEVRETDDNGNPLKSKNGNLMIKISIDTTDADKQPHYFMDQFRNDIRPGKKWPNNGVIYMETETDGKCTRNFKGFVTSVERSNPGFSVQWGDMFCQCLKNKLIGGVFREELGVYNNKETHQRKLAWFCANDKVADAAIPNPVETREHKSWNQSGGITSAPADAEGFMNIPDNAQEELPFL